MAGRVLAVLLLVGTVARADDAATAEAAFLHAQELVKAGDYTRACPLFEASYRADAALGTLINLADCHEHVGKTATAWAEFRDALERAQKRSDVEGDSGQKAKDQQRVDYATAHIAALEKRLVRLRLTAPAIPGLVVQRDGVDATLLLGADVPVDPGEHAVEARAPGRTPYATKVAVAGEGTTVPFAIPDLVAAPVDNTPVAPVAPATPNKEPVRIDLAVGSEVMQGRADRPDSFSTRIGARLGIDAGIIPHVSARLAGHLIPGDQNGSGLWDVTLDVEGRIAPVPFVQLWAAAGPAYGGFSITCKSGNPNPCPMSASGSGLGGTLRGGVGFGRGGFAIAVEAAFVRISDGMGGFGSLTIGGTLSFGFSI
jgi:hypothetical protein